MGVPEKGWLVVTPVVSPCGTRAILVRRGWVPDSWRRQQQAGSAPEACSGVGVVSAGERGNSFVPANVPEAGEWFTLDVAAMVRSPFMHSHCLPPAAAEALTSAHDNRVIHALSLSGKVVVSNAVPTSSRPR